MATPTIVEQMLNDLDTNVLGTQALLTQLRAQLVQIAQPTPVTNDAQLHAALTKGGVIELAAGTYTGRYDVTVPYTTLKGVTLPDQRVHAGDCAAVTLKASDAFKPALRVMTEHVRVEGIAFAMGHRDTSVVRIGDGGATFVDPLQQPDDVVIDKCEILADPATGGWRGIEAHSRACTIMRSRIVDFWYQGRDSQGFYGCNGPGPYLIADCHIEASGENILFGGGSIRSAAMHPANATIIGNTILKPQAWRGLPGAVKNSIEFKAMIGGVIENNLIDGCWKDAQAGAMIVLTPRNPYGNNPFVQVKDIVIRGNRTVNHTQNYAINILYTDYEQGHPTQATENITVERNLFEDSPNGILITGGGLGGALTVVNNTMPKVRYQCLLFDGTPTAWVKPTLVWRDNVHTSGEYGIQGKGTASGVPALDAFCVPGYDCTGNVIERYPQKTIPWPPGNTLLAPGALAGQLDSQFKYLPDPTKGW